VQHSHRSSVDQLRGPCFDSSFRLWWIPCKKATYLMAILNEPFAHILHAIWTGVMYEKFTEVLQSCHSDHRLAAVFHSQLKRKTRLSRESPQEFPAAMDHLSHPNHVVLPKQQISKEAAHSCSNGLRGARHKLTPTLGGARRHSARPLIRALS
jgi:hypothetical protein